MIQNHKSFFVVSIVLLCVCLLVSAYTLFIYHCACYECKNFSRTEAIISRGIANILAKCACGLWEIEVPENTEKIAEHEGSFFHADYSLVFMHIWYTYHIICNGLSVSLRHLNSDDRILTSEDSAGISPEICGENGKRRWYIS